ncbi:predicted protein [Phaeodactylum tricornutum CCAP 1055/1]|uniref:Uncharacterized protein n=1 Tax=Phaeodactylum tricornutum (strain CCAP 1055/1) TaxID=556484 RepID=B7GCB5_PHATC|nr:predicted protein [Phaeodactylum tricornutum CCAP 1055/1]EEC43745.1 predicted protein [Phaeodactylum tricornutum CCAP 1055/1]|eukprot:XP_002184686.1 predicted protein [Phaeodactylum tricornutum CCAP 1055/1]
MMKACAWDKEGVNGVNLSRMWSRAVQPHVFLVTTSSHLSRFCIPTFILLTVIYCIGHCSYPQPAFSSWCFSLSEILGMVQFGIVWGSSATCDSAIPAALFACQRTSPGRIRQYQSDKCFDAQSYTVCSTTVTGVATSTTLRKQSIPDCGPPDGAFGVPLDFVVFQSAREQALSTATIPRPFKNTSDTMLRWGPNRTQMVSIGSSRCWITFPGVHAAAHVGPAGTAPFVAASLFGVDDMSFGESITRPRVCLCRVNKISPIEAVNESKAQVVPKTNQQIAYTSDILQTSVTPAKDTKPRPFQFRQETEHSIQNCFQGPAYDNDNLLSEEEDMSIALGWPSMPIVLEDATDLRSLVDSITKSPISSVSTRPVSFAPADPFPSTLETHTLCYGIHHRDMSVRQVKDTNRNVGGDHVDDGDGTVEFVSALLYDTMYSRDDYGNPLEEDTGKDYTNE